VKLWLAKAEEDLLAGELILKGSMPSYGAVSFHAQQAAEKTLKALLIRYQADFGKTHNLSTLIQLAEVVSPGITLRLAGAEALTLYAVEARYPTEEPSVGREEANHHLAVGRKVFDEVGALLSLYLDAGRPGG